jgi:hypothetical protein
MEDHCSQENITGKHDQKVAVSHVLHLPLVLANFRCMLSLRLVINIVWDSRFMVLVQMRYFAIASPATALTSYFTFSLLSIIEETQKSDLRQRNPNTSQSADNFFASVKYFLECSPSRQTLPRPVAPSSRSRFPS